MRPSQNFSGILKSRGYEVTMKLECWFVLYVQICAIAAFTYLAGKDFNQLGG